MLNRFPRRVALAAAGVIAVAFSTTACSNQDDSGSKDCKESYTIGFSHSVGEAASVKVIKKIIKQYSADKGCTKVLYDNTTASNLESQRSAIEGWVTQGVDAIVIFPVDPSSFVNLQKQAQEKGIKWLTYASPMDGEDGSVGFDSDQAGTIVAEDMTAWIKKRYPDGDISAAVTTFTALPTLAGRWEKPQAALKALDVPVVSAQDCADQACGLQIVEDALRENPNLRVFTGVNDDTALGAQKAFENAGLSADDVYIAGSDGGPEAIANIKDPGKGGFRVTAALDLRSLAQDIVDNSIAAITGKGEANSETPAILVKTGDDEQLDKLLKEFK